jgi:hypothetical protein
MKVAVAHALFPKETSSVNGHFKIFRAITKCGTTLGTLMAQFPDKSLAAKCQFTMQELK